MRDSHHYPAHSMDSFTIELNRVEQRPARYRRRLRSVVHLTVPTRAALEFT
jgi:hypothetical protein